ncbi:MAG: hypothetical protein QXM96_03890 [Candidatus Woesearchaeota archaeon]
MKNKLIILPLIVITISCAGLKLFREEQTITPIETIKLKPEESIRDKIVNLIRNFETSTTKNPASFDSKIEDNRNAFTYQLSKTINPSKRILITIKIINFKSGSVYYIINIEIQTKNPDSVEKLEIKSASKDNTIDQLKNILYAE